MPGLCSLFTTPKKVDAELFGVAHESVVRGRFLDQAP